MLDNKTKKAAMFGLDARIALAIFGALSVITGAALYSAIGKAKATAVLTELREIGKAWEQYYLDTGVDLTSRATDLSDWHAYSYKTADLNKSSVSGWKGPYLNYENGSTELLKHSTFGYILLEKITDGDWSAAPTGWLTEKCDTAKEPCYVWASITEISNLNIANTIDNMVDGGDGAGSGDFRWVTSDLSKRYSLKIAPIKNPND